MNIDYTKLSDDEIVKYLETLESPIKETRLDDLLYDLAQELVKIRKLLEGVFRERD